MILPLHRAKRQTFDEVALGIQREGESWGNREHDPGGNLAIVDARGGDKGQRADGDGLLVSRSQVPGRK